MTRPALTVCLALAALQPAPLRAQQARDEVVAVVQSLFDAMAARDSVRMKSLLTPEGYLHAVRADTVLSATAMSHADFITRIAASRQRPVERMFVPTVLIDGPLAVVWARYDFHADTTLTHCGTDAVTLVRTAAGWKITSVAYTVELRGCPPGP